MSRKKRINQRPSRQTPPRPKISQSLWEFAGEFIRIGDTVEDRQNRLNAACSAWNMACNTPELRKKHLDQYVRGYSKYNPHVDAEELEDVRKDMETLIEVKLKMFPNDLRQVIAARIINEGGQDRIEAAAMGVQR